jgi:hypothetical protein
VHVGKQGRGESEKSEKSESEGGYKPGMSVFFRRQALAESQLRSPEMCRGILHYGTSKKKENAGGE